MPDKVGGHFLFVSSTINMLYILETLKTENLQTILGKSPKPFSRYEREGAEFPKRQDPGI